MHIFGKKGMAYSTIKGYSAAVRNLRTGYGCQSPLDTPMPKLKQVLRDMNISQARAGTHPKRKLHIKTSPLPFSTVVQRLPSYNSCSKPPRLTR